MSAVDLTAVIVCGSRNWTDYELVEAKLDAIHLEIPNLLIVEGGAKGADMIAGFWASQRGVETIRMPAEWKVHSKEFCPGVWCITTKNHCVGAGACRNQAMLTRALQEEHQMVVAFKDDFNMSGRSGGTEDMVRRAKAAGVHGVVVRHPR